MTDHPPICDTCHEQVHEHPRYGWTHDDPSHNEHPVTVREWAGLELFGRQP